MRGEVGWWLEELGLSEYAEAFAENRIDADVLPTLTNDDLKDIGVVHLVLHFLTDQYRDVRYWG